MARIVLVPFSIDLHCISMVESSWGRFWMLQEWILLPLGIVSSHNSIFVFLSKTSNIQSVSKYTHKSMFFSV